MAISPFTSGPITIGPYIMPKPEKEPVQRRGFSVICMV